MQIKLIPLDKIIVADRKRKDFGEIGSLAESISKFGLFHPIILEDNYHLRAGERRLRAFKVLKKDSIPCIFFSNLTELERKEIELRENLDRMNLNWQEEVALKDDITRLKKEENPKWTAEDCNEFIGDKKSLAQYNNDLYLARSMKKYPELKEEKDKSNAFRKAQRLDEKKLRSLLVEVGGGKELSKDSPVTIKNMDCLVGIKELSNESVDLIITDFPFGIGLDKNHDFNKTWDEVYPDDESDLLTELLPKLAKEFHRVLKEGAHAYIFYPSKFHCSFRHELEKHLHIDPIPLIWNKMVGGTSFSPYSRYAPNYEPIFHCWKGNARKMAKPGFSVLNYENKVRDKTHPAEKPIPLIQYLVEQSSIEGEMVLDTFSGSGVTMAVAKSMGRRGVAFELSKRWYELGIERLMG